METVSELIQELRRTGKWKWMLHYRDNRRLKENARSTLKRILLFIHRWILAVDFKHAFFPLQIISCLSPANITPTWLSVFLITLFASHYPELSWILLKQLSLVYKQSHHNSIHADAEILSNRFFSMSHVLRPG